MVEQLKGFQQHVKDTYVLKKIFRFATFATHWENLDEEPTHRYFALKNANI